MALEPGTPAPPFELLARDRSKVTLDSYPGKHLVLAFYPLAFTGGCTSEMTAFRTYTDSFERANAQVLGISVDSWAAAGEFESKLGLEFPLLSDFPANRVGRDYGVYNEKAGMHGRTTVVIDREGFVRSVHHDARDFESHPLHALDTLRAMGEHAD